MPQIKVSPNHSNEVRELAASFDYEHLPEDLQGVSQQFYDLAANMIHDLPHFSVNLEIGLTHLLQAKDACVRAAVLARRETK